MIKSLFFILFVLQSALALAAVELHIDFHKNKIKQGGLEKVVISLDEYAVQNVELQKLKGQTLGDVLYLHNVSSPVRKSGGAFFEADAVVAFLKVPPKDIISHKDGKSEVVIKWSKVEIVPTEPAQELLFGKFEIPSRANLIAWSVYLLALLVLFIVGFKFARKRKIQKELKKKRSELKDKIMSATQYDEVVSLWQKKSAFLKEFPHIEEPFKKMELILFKYQFKPYQSEDEKSEVMTAYREFITQIQGGFSGI